MFNENQFIFRELLHVLDLLADFFEFRFSCDDVLSECGIIGLGADGVEFAVDFLAEEVQ